MNNVELRSILDRARKENGIFAYEVAYSLGVNDVTFSRWLRKELTSERRTQILAAIDKLQKKVG